MIDLSLGELKTTIRKAARGAGFDWASAAEIGWAACWAAEQGIDITDTLAGYLAGPLADDPGLGWTRTTGLCPLRTGIALCDYIDLKDWRWPDQMQMKHPVLILPFVAAAARDGHMIAQIGGTRIIAAHDTLEGLRPGLMPAEATVTLRRSPVPRQSTRCANRALITPAALAQLEALAQRTYAPATEASRRFGAGSDAPDID